MCGVLAIISFIFKIDLLIYALEREKAQAREQMERERESEADSS